MKSAIMMFHMWLPNARSILHRAESSFWSTPAHLCPSIYRIVLVRAGQRYASSVRTTLVKRRGIPHPQVCPACQQGSPGSYRNLPVFLPNGTPHICPISNPAQGRSARFGSTWSGGEVELVTLTNSGMVATQLLTVPLAPSWPSNRMLYEGP